ncbi:MAG: hypothetical protein AAF206_12100 [Bacteroidota bacterium]
MLSAQAANCDCEVPASDEAALEQADVAVAGRVVFVNTNWMSGGMKYSFQVEKSWKRSVDKLLIVNSPFSQECGQSFEDGQRYLLFANKKFGFKTNACAGSRLLTKQEEPFPNQTSFAPQRSAMAGIMLWTIVGICVFASSVLAFVVLRKKINPSLRKKIDPQI